MQEATLLKLALVFSLLGVIALYFISTAVKLPEGILMEAESDYIIRGTIEKITERESVTFINLQREDVLDVIMFKDYPVDLHQGDYIEAIGKASKDEEGNMELIAKDIRVIK